MSETPDPTTTPPEEAARSVEEHLTELLTHARWFGGKGRPFTVTGVRRVGDLGGTGAADDPLVVVELVEVTYGDATDGATGSRGDEAATELYQVPLACYRDRQERLDHAFVGWWDVPGLPADADGSASYAHVYDAPHDRVALHAWLVAFDRAGNGAAGGAWRVGGLDFHRLPGHDLEVDARASLFSGEQSNSSVMFGEDALMKVFRKVTPGVNPDVEVHEVLTRAGSPTRPSCSAGSTSRSRAGSCSSRCCSSSSARRATGGTSRRPPCGTSSPRRTSTPTRWAVTSPARPRAWASRSPRPTPRSRTTSRSRYAVATPPPGSRPR
ncbi:maltokinase N-terminal cap-like domain-containing protein [Nocardioides zeae]